MERMVSVWQVCGSLIDPRVEGALVVSPGEMAVVYGFSHTIGRNQRAGNSRLMSHEVQRLAASTALAADSNFTSSRASNSFTRH